MALRDSSQLNDRSDTSSQLSLNPELTRNLYSELNDLKKITGSPQSGNSLEIPPLFSGQGDQKILKNIDHQLQDIDQLLNQLANNSGGSTHESGDGHHQKHHGGKSKGHGHGGENPPAGTNPGNPGDPPSNPGDPPPNPGTASKSKFLMGTAVSGDNIPAFDKSVGFDQNELNVYVNQNRGKTINAQSLTDDLKSGVTPMVSLRTTDYSNVASGGDDNYLKQQANSLADALKNSNSPNSQILLRPDWEMNLNLNHKYGSPQQFVQAWQQMHDVVSKQLTADGVDPSRVKWVFAPGTYHYNDNGAWSAPAVEQAAKQLAPDIDYIGADGYTPGSGAPQSPSQIFGQTLDLAKSLDKPFFIAETGVASTHGVQGELDYFKEMEQFVQENKQYIGGISWFSEGQNDVRNNPTVEQAFGQMEQEITSLYGN